MSMEPTNRGVASRFGAPIVNPLRAPDVIHAIRVFIAIEGRGLPGKPSGKSILRMVEQKFHIFAGLNQLAGALTREGITRGGPVNRISANPSERTLRQHRSGPHPTLPPMPLETEEARLARQEEFRVSEVRRHAEFRERERERLQAGSDPQLIQTPDVARKHDIAMARPVITRTPGHPAHRQHTSAVPKVTLNGSPQNGMFQPEPAAITTEGGSPFSDRVYREPVVVPAPIPKASARIRECCWPLGDPGTVGFRYCDVPHQNAGPYCEEHHGRAYDKAPAVRYRPDPLPKFTAGYR